MFSLGYLNEKGLLKTTQFSRYNGRMNIDSDVTNWLKAGMNASYSRNENNTAVENSSGNSNVWYTAQLMAPIFPVYEKDAEGKTVLDKMAIQCLIMEQTARQVRMRIGIPLLLCMMTNILLRATT